MRKILTKAISLICVLVLLAAFTPSALAYTEETVINWADKTVYTDVTGIFPKGYIDAETGGQTGTGNFASGDVNSVFGVGDSSTKNSGYNIKLNNPVAQTGTTNAARSKFEIDLGAERTIDYIDIYQYKNRITEIKVYKMTAAQYTTADNGVCYLTDNFVNGTTLIGEATFDHGTDAGLLLNEIDACNTPDRIELNGTQNARYLLLVVTEVVASKNTMFQLQKITVNKKGTIGVTAVKNWTDKNTYNSIKGSCPYDVSNTKNTIDSLFGDADADVVNNLYKAEISYPQLYDNNSTAPMSKILVDLGEERAIDYIDIYQYKDRIKEIKVYKVTNASIFNQANTTNPSASDNFIKTYTELLGEATFDNGGVASTTLNEMDNCIDPDRISFSETKTARYLFIAVTEALENQGFSKILLQKITVNSVADTLDASAFEFDTELFQNSGNTKNISVFAVQRSGDVMVDCDVLKTDVANMSQVNLFANKIEIDSTATRLDFIILDSTTLVPLMKVPYTIEKN